MNARLLPRTALASLCALMLVSLAFVFVSPVVPTLVSAVPVVAAHRLPPGLMLAVVKVGLLVLVFNRVWNVNVYSLQWSSMFILLFIAEGTVRAASDPQPSATLGLAEAIVATIYFAAVLAILRPVKRQARRRDADGP
jgi:uncharacterized membrane protein